MNLGILGGTFDPPHRGHLVLAERCADALELETVFFVPAFLPPHKLDRRLSSFDARLRLVRAAIAEEPRFEALDLERNRGGISYTVETLRDLHGLHPAAQFWLLLGRDSLHDLAAWRAPDEIAKLARFAVYGRPGVSEETPARFAENTTYVEGPLIDISSTELRGALGRGEPVGEMIPPAVRVEIARLGLYRAGERT